MKRITTAALLLAATPPLLAAPPEELEPGQRVRLSTNPPAGAMGRTGEFRMPGRSVGKGGEGITVSLDEGDATFSLPGQRLEGRLLRADSETLTLRLRGWDEPVTVLRRSVSRLEIRRQGRSRTSNAVIGAAVGAGLAVGIAVASPGASDGGWPDLRPLESSLTGVAAAVGMGVGALVGLAVGGETWTAVDPRPSLRLSVRPTRGGAAAALSVGF